jgi:hypothetical protein
MCERVNMTDWEGPERIGETLGMSTWAETSLMLTTIEIPGVYVRPDLSLVIAFDHINTELVEDGPAELKVRFINPTQHHAAVRLFHEQGDSVREPLPENYLYHCDLVELMPGSSATMVFPKSGIQSFGGAPKCKAD